MTKNNLVLYKNQPALITGASDGKFEITLEHSMKKVREKDIFLLDRRECLSLHKALDALLPPVDFLEAADFFEGETPYFTEIAELLWGNYPPELSWKIWEALFTASDFFICTNPAEPVTIRTAQDRAEQQKKQAEKADAERMRQDFITALRACLHNNTPIDRVESFTPFFQELEAAALGSLTESKLLKDAKLEQSAEQAHELLLKTGFWGIEKNPYPARFGHSLHSSKVRLPDPVYKTGLLDLTALPAFAIDNEQSTDPDDAISFDGKYLWIHIANPSDTVIEDSAADTDACGRGATLYAPEGTARMLGEQAIAYFALGLEAESYALSFKLLLDEAGEILETEVHRTKLSVTRLTYQQADEQKDSPQLAPFFHIAARNRTRRDLAGAVTITFPETSIRIVEENGVKSVKIQQVVQTEASAMIKEMMLLAGEAAARFAFKNGIPFQYISQESPVLPGKLPSGLAGEYRKRRSMRPRNVGTIPSMHAALGIAMYGQVTSPLRRYGDLVSHRQLLHFLDNEPLTDAETLIIKIAAGDIAARSSVQAERASRQHWTLVYLLQHPDWQGTAVVIDTQGKKAHVFIPELSYESDIVLKREPELNDEICIKVHTIRLAYLHVHFVEV